jgi:hypothetical protein
MRASILLLVAVLALGSTAFASSEPLVVHEWGTFTSLQDEGGNAIGGINVDDEPVPRFVHDLMRNRTYASPNIFAKGLPGGSREEITMRLETPVMYFHLPPGSAPRSVDVSVQFRGGLLSQFYPDAASNVSVGKMFPAINEKTIGKLDWPAVNVGTHAAGPATDSHVWLAPRAVDAADLTAASGESERYLFYRGVGHIDAPVTATQKDGQVYFTTRNNYALTESGYVMIPKLWLAHFSPDGTCRAIELGPLGGPVNQFISTPLDLQNAKQPVLDLNGLRASMKQSLVSNGLFEDEAEAMLCTWEKSYFKSAGQRLFYIVPRGWTDHYLPLKLSADAKIERVMIGRLELISPEQREALKELATMKDITPQMAHAWDLYNSLGRFKSALLRNQLSQKPETGLRQFVNLYGI